MKKYLPLFLILPFLYNCSGTGSHSRTDYSKVYNTATHIKDEKGLDILSNQFANNIDHLWGANELIVVSRMNYVKYSTDHKTRSHINFDDGVVTIETIDHANYKQSLKNGIVNTLLMDVNAEEHDLFHTAISNGKVKSFLADQILNQKGKHVLTQQSANEFANYLIKNKVASRPLTNGSFVQVVKLPMIANHVEVRGKQFIPLVRKAAKRYDIDERLILAIMKVESTFNPYAVSYSNAVGLMQVVPSTAGADVFKHVKNKSGKPSKKYLFDPHNNIDTGAAYLWLLQSRYLTGVTNPHSIRFLTIASYNSGAGMTLRIFDNDRKKAVEKINKLLPEQIYAILKNNHPSEQARRYLIKVNAALEQYKFKAI